MTIKTGHKIMLTATAVIGFAAFSVLCPLSVYASDRHHEEEMLKNIEGSEDVAEQIEERQRNTMSELERLKAQTQISRDSMVDTTSGAQSYFEDSGRPGTTGGTPEDKKTKKVYEYDKNTGADTPQRLFNNVR